jgi:hypothetical protein
MKMATIVVCAAVVATATGCKTMNSDGSEVRDDGAIQGDAAANASDQCVDPEQIDVTRDTIEFQRTEEGQCAASVEAAQQLPPTWRMIVNGKPVCGEGLGLDDDRIDLGGRWYTVFVWPKDSEAVPGTLNERYARLQKLMTEYAKLVGTCLHETPTGAGAEHWVGGKRWDDWSVIGAARQTGDSVKFCAAVRTRLVETYVKPGSTYCQYGNCGEGGHVGSCLAKRMGFADDEIRLCASRNDHMFGMVKDLSKPDGRWCILDRWDLIGHYRCDVDVDDASEEIIYKKSDGTWSKTGQNWFQRARCATLDAYIKDPSLLN